MSKESTFVRYQRPPGGYKISTEDLEYHRNLTEEQITAAALSDPDCPPMTEEQLARMRPVPLARSARWRSDLSQQAFADLFGFTIKHLQDLEKGRAEPDPVTEAYLKLIRSHPEVVRELMKTAA